MSTANVGSKRTPEQDNVHDLKRRHVDASHDNQEEAPPNAPRERVDRTKVCFL
jgi:hypothetical protein